MWPVLGNLEEVTWHCSSYYRENIRGDTEEEAESKAWMGPKSGKAHVSRATHHNLRGQMSLSPGAPEGGPSLLRDSKRDGGLGSPCLATVTSAFFVTLTACRSDGGPPQLCSLSEAGTWSRSGQSGIHLGILT